MQSSSLSAWIDGQQQRGLYGFDAAAARAELGLSPGALAKALQRQQRKGRIRRIRKGFHVIIPVEFAQTGMIPPDWFIDDLMRYLGLPYYLGLLTAAGLHGAAHQQAQQYQVVVDRHVAPIRSRQLSIRFFSKQAMVATPVAQMKGHAAMLPVATPAATAFDLVRHANRIGGLDAVATVLAELAEGITAEDLIKSHDSEPSSSVVQRLGWLLDQLGQPSLADTLHRQLKRQNSNPSRALLDPAANAAGACANRWNIIENCQPVLES